MFQISAGQLPRGKSTIHAYAQALKTKSQVRSKLGRMKDLDNSPRDIAPNLNQVILSNESLDSPTTPGLVAFRPNGTPLLPDDNKVTGTAEFANDGSPVSLALDTDDDKSSFRFKVLSDGSKLYAAPTEDKNLWGVQHQVLLEKPDGTMFIDDASISEVDAVGNRLQSRSNFQAGA